MSSFTGFFFCQMSTDSTVEWVGISSSFIILSSWKRRAHNGSAVYFTPSGQREKSLSSFCAMREINQRNNNKKWPETSQGPRCTSYGDKGGVWWAVSQWQCSVDIINLTQIARFNWVHDLWTGVSGASSKKAWQMGHTDFQHRLILL